MPISIVALTPALPTVQNLMGVTDVVRLFRADLFTELAVVNARVGDLAYAKDTATLYTWNGAAWVGSGGSGTPGGINKNVQYNNNGTLGGIANNASATNMYLQQVSAGTPSFAQVSDADLLTSDVTTNNATTAKHGFVPKPPNDATKFYDGTGAYNPAVRSIDVAGPAQEFTSSGGPVTASGVVTLVRKAVFTGSVTGAATINFNNGDKQILTMTGNCTFTLTNPVNGALYTLILVQDATGGRTGTFPASVKLSGGGTSFPLTGTALKGDAMQLLWDGTNYWQVSVSYTL